MNLPFANRHGYSDVNPYEVVRVVSAKCLEVRPMKAKLADGEKPNFAIGGFAARCLNQNDLNWDIEPDSEAPVTRIRLGKSGWWKDANGNRFVPDSKPVKFYDYNF